MTMNALERFRLDGKVAVVVGGARDLGFDIADALACAGAKVVVTSRVARSAERAARLLEERHHGIATGRPLDVFDVPSIDLLSEWVPSQFGHVDILVNNVGGVSEEAPTGLFERRVEDIQELIQLNLLGPPQCCRAFARHMVRQKSGKIINVASVGGVVGRDRRIFEAAGMSGPPVDYAAAKAGVIGLTRDLATLLARHGVHVNAISPGAFGPRDISVEFIRSYCEQTPLGRLGRDGVDIQGAALFLASSASDYMVGQNLVLDGGYTSW
jgi:NAD(P)-dependent dehydrogenase (short-subunit alcohol dehydrogenase family)